MIREKSRACTVCVRSEQKNADGETQIFETKSEGQLSERRGVLYVLYEENAEETQGGPERKKEQTPGMRVKNLLKIEENPLRVNLKKSGAVSWKMTFEQGKKGESEYETPYGMLKIRVETEHAALKREQEKTSLRLLYALLIQGEKQADCRLELEII